MVSVIQVSLRRLGVDSGRAVRGRGDKSKMSRKDPRKYKRRAGGAARKVKA